MIRYGKASAYTVLYWWGGINRLVLPKAIWYVFVAGGLYIFQSSYDIEFYTNDPLFQNTVKGILSFLVFLLVFRLNQCMSRYYAVYALITDTFYGIERLILDFCNQMSGDDGESFKVDPAKGNAAGKDGQSHKDSLWTASCLCIAAKINIIRLSLAYALATVLHFQLLCAASDSQGELDEVGVSQVVFLYCRLRALLHDEEMALLDHSLSVVRDATPGQPVKYRVEICRYRLNEDPHLEHLIGRAEADRSSGGALIVPAPKIVMSILTQALMRPSDQKWGYQSRMFTVFSRITLKLVNDAMHLESIIMSPTPLPYLQHCRVLFSIFSIMFPMSMDTSKGVFDNVVLPLIIFWAVMGFEVLSASLENPMGNDDTDINFFDKIHALEVNAEQIFNASECHRAPLHSALLKTENLVMGERYCGQTTLIRNHMADPTKHFRSYFRWVPFPTAVLSDLMDSHGDVGILHELRLSWRALVGELPCLPDFSLRQMLRRTLYRRKGGQLYQAVNIHSTNGNRDLGLQSEACSATDADFNKDDAVVDFNKDPNYFCHYLEFMGAGDVDDQPEEQVGDGCSVPRNITREWKTRALDLLEDHPAQQLLKKTHPDDTTRSLMLQTPRSGRMKGLGGWESLS
jgi:hypothetical protein